MVWGSHYRDLISSLGFMLYLFVCVCDTCAGTLREPVELWLRATLNCLLVCKRWESNSAVPEDLEALLTAKPFLQPLIYILKVYILVVVPRLRRKEGRPARGWGARRARGQGFAAVLPVTSGGRAKAKCSLNRENPLADAYCGAAVVRISHSSCPHIGRRASINTKVKLHCTAWLSGSDQACCAV